MEEKLPKLIRQFRQEIFHSLPAYSKIDIRTILVDRKGWFPFITQISLLGNKDQIDEIRDLPDTSIIKPLHKIIPIGELDKIFDGLSNNSLVFEDRSYNFPFQTERFATWHFNGSHPEVPSAQVAIQAIKCVWSEPNNIGQSYEWSHLNWILRSADIPFYNLGLLINKMQFLIQKYQNLSQPLLDVLAISPLRFNYLSSLNKHDGKNFTAEVFLPNELAKEKLTVGVNLYGSGQPIERFSLRFLDICTKISEETYQIKIDGRNFPIVDLFLTFDNRCYSHMNIRTGHQPNIAISIHSVFDSNIEQAKKYLDISNTKSHLFTKGVSLLFYFLGYQVENLEDLNLKGEVDAVAFTRDENTFILAECTLSSPGIDNKLAKLHAKKVAVIEQLRQMGFTSTKVIAAVFSPKRGDQIAVSESLQAGVNNIAIITQEKIGELIRMAETLSSLSDINAFIMSCIPPTTLPNPAP